MIARMQRMIHTRAVFSLAVYTVTLLAFGLRLYAAARLNIDSDEPVYLADAISYANYMRAGDFKVVAWSEKTY